MCASTRARANTSLVRRVDQRRAAVIALYQHDLTGKPLADTLGEDASPFACALAGGVSERSGELDEVIERHSNGWSVDRIHPLERSILRVALLELLFPELTPGEQPIPPEGAIEEAVKSAKVFCSSEAPGFINGVLGAVLREVRENASTP
jgi:N utilization substance protein B